MNEIWDTQSFFRPNYLRARFMDVEREINLGMARDSTQVTCDKANLGSSCEPYFAYEIKASGVLKNITREY